MNHSMEELRKKGRELLKEIHHDPEALIGALLVMIEESKK